MNPSFHEFTDDTFEEFLLNNNSITTFKELRLYENQIKRFFNHHRQLKDENQLLTEENLVLVDTNIKLELEVSKLKNEINELEDNKFQLVQDIYNNIKNKHNDNLMLIKEQIESEAIDKSIIKEINSLHCKIAKFVTSLKQEDMVSVQIKEVQKLLSEYGSETKIYSLNDLPIMSAILQRSVFDHVNTFILNYFNNKLEVNNKAKSLLNSLDLLAKSRYGYKHNSARKDNEPIDDEEWLKDERNLHLNINKILNKINDPLKQLEFSNLSKEIVYDFIRLIYFNPKEKIEFIWIPNSFHLDLRLMKILNNNYNLDNDDNITFDNYLVDFCSFPLFGKNLYDYSNDNKYYTLAQIYPKKKHF
ncbi:6981_t:CDS:2 [Entrophospora sp. SA101]|nr:6981_t:CDS:2 [Entrophospora sp. SA101]